MEACFTPTLVKLVKDEPPRLPPIETRAACGLDGLFCFWVGRLSLPAGCVNSGPVFQLLPAGQWPGLRVVIVERRDACWATREKAVVSTGPILAALPKVQDQVPDIHADLLRSLMGHTRMDFPQLGGRWDPLVNLPCPLGRGGLLHHCPCEMGRGCATSHSLGGGRDEDGPPPFSSWKRSPFL